MKPDKSGNMENSSSGRMMHSLSTPSGVDCILSSSRHQNGKKITVRIQILDDSVTVFQVQPKALGRVLFEQLCRQLNLLEADYFGLEYQEPSTHVKYWLDLEKPLNRQLGLSLIDPVFKFCVKFYTPDPLQLEEEYTRYLFCLQIKRDLATGTLQCSDSTAALMASYIVQASCGDYVEEDYPNHSYLSSFKFVPHQDALLQQQIMENHKKHVGQSPAEADLNLLEIARRCELYGMKMHTAKDIEGITLNLAVAHMGICVFQGFTRINTFSWAKIRKISFKRKRFLIKLHPEGFGYYKDTVEFLFEGRNECKSFWKKCVENHSFFRCTSVEAVPRKKARVLSRGSSFRYSGKTQKQIIQFVRDNYVKRQSFQRSQSFRKGSLRTTDRSQSNTCVNFSVSAHALLPAGTVESSHGVQATDSTSLFQTKKEATQPYHLQDTHTHHILPRKTKSQLEVHQTKINTKESATVMEQQHQGVTHLDHMNSNYSASLPVRHLNMTMSPSQVSSNNSTQAEYDQSFVLPTQTSDQIQQSHRFTKTTPLNRVVVEEHRKYVHLPSPLQSQHMSNNIQCAQQQILTLNQEKEICQKDQQLNLTTGLSSINSNNIRITDQEHLINSIDYSNTSCSISKQTSSDQSDKLIYSDINDLIYQKYPNDEDDDDDDDVVDDNDDDDEEYKPENDNNLSKTSVSTTTPIKNTVIRKNSNECDIYATINPKNKNKTKFKHVNNQFIDETIIKHTKAIQSNSNDLKNIEENEYFQVISNKDDKSKNLFSNYFDMNSNYQEPTLDKSSIHQMNGSNSFHSENSQSDTQIFSRNYDLIGVNSNELFGDNCLNNFHSSLDSHKVYGTIFENNTSTERNSSTVLSDRYKSSSEKLEFELSSLNLYSAIKYENADEKNLREYANLNKDTWLTSTSCKELHKYSFVDSETTKSVDDLTDNFLLFNCTDLPVTRYNDFRHSMFLKNNFSDQTLDDFNTISDMKVYSSSYPGSLGQTKCKSNMNLNFFGSTDDCSHDSYELLERRKYEYDHTTMSDHIRLSSFNSEDTSDDEGGGDLKLPKSRSVVDFKFATDIFNSIWDCEDPRYLPKEKLFKSSDDDYGEDEDIKPVKMSKLVDIRQHGQDNSIYNGIYNHSISDFSSSKKDKTSISSDFISHISGQDSKDSLNELFTKNYEMPMTTIEKIENITDHHEKSSSQESKSEYYDANSYLPSSYDKSSMDYNCTFRDKSKVKSHDSLISALRTSSKKNYFTDLNNLYSTLPVSSSSSSSSSHKKTSSSSKTSKVHSISLQNVEIEGSHSSTILLNQTSDEKSNLDDEDDDVIKDEEDSDDIQINTRSSGGNIFTFRRKSDSENIFSFDQDKIDLLTSTVALKNATNAQIISKSEDSLTTPERKDGRISIKNIQKTEIMEKKDAKNFEEFNYRTNKDKDNKLHYGNYGGHTTVERTKSDPNSLAQRSNLGGSVSSRRHVLIHQKSIDLTPVDSSDEDYIYRDIPSAPPLCRVHGHFDAYKVFDSFEKTVAKIGIGHPPIKDLDKINNDIPYILHKRHIMNGTAPSPIERKHTKSKSPKSPRSPKQLQNGKVSHNIVDYALKSSLNTAIPSSTTTPTTIAAKKDTTTAAAANTTTTDISNDLPANFDDDHHLIEHFKDNIRQNTKSDDTIFLKKPTKYRGPLKSRNAIKTKHKNKTRITSFSSDDESLDSDDIFGSAESIPLHLEFSPPQSRKEMEPILKIEQNKIISGAWARAQTMSSTEIEGSPPQCRKLPDFENRYNMSLLDPVYSTMTELRKISERSISIPSSEEEERGVGGDVPITRKMEQIQMEIKNIPQPLLEKQQQHILQSESSSKFDVNNSNKNERTHNQKLRSKLIEEILDPGLIMKSRGHAPILFAHARLNLSEGSAFASLQRQQQLPDDNRRARSLDNPVISLQNLPLMTAFSSKDDTVELEDKSDVLLKDKRTTKMMKSSSTGISFDAEEQELLNRLEFIEKITLRGVKIKDKRKSKMKLKSGNHLIFEIPKYNFDLSPFGSASSSKKTSPGISRASSAESTDKGKTKSTKESSSTTRKLSPTKLEQLAYSLDKMESKKLGTERPKSLENNNNKRPISKAQQKSQEEEERRRKERQQKLYESAVKQTITMLSPVKEQIPSFPAPEDKIVVKTEGDKIIIQTEFKSKAEDHVVIAKSPKKLDNSIVKISRSFDENRRSEKIDKANRSFEDRNKSIDEIELNASFDDTSEKPIQKSLGMTHQEIRQSQFSEMKSFSLDPSRIQENYLKVGPIKQVGSDTKIKCYPSISKINHLESAKSLDRQDYSSPKLSSSDRRTLSQPEHTTTYSEEIDMQAVISERRSLDLLSRQSTSLGENQKIDEYSSQKTSIESDEGGIQQSQQQEHKSIESDESELKIIPPVPEEFATEEKPLSTIDTSQNKNKSKIEKYQQIKTINAGKTYESERSISSDMSSFEQCNKNKLTDEMSSSESMETLPSKPTSAESPYTSGESQRNPCLNDWNTSLSVREKNSIEEESSLSCAISQPFGMSNIFGDVDDNEVTKSKQIRLEQNIREKSTSKKADLISTRIFVSPSIEDVPIDLESDFNQDQSEENNLNIEDLEPPPLEFDIDLQEFECIPTLSDEEKLEFESKDSGDFESQSSIDATAYCLNLSEDFQKKNSATANVEKFWQSLEYEGYQQSCEMMEETDKNIEQALFDDQKENDSSYQDDFENSSVILECPIMTNTLSHSGENSVNFNAALPLTRTLSRISERSTNSEKSSIDDDVSKVSTQSPSIHDESVVSSDHQASLSTDTRSNTNLAYISDADRRTSAEMPEIPCDSAILEKYNESKNSTMTGRFVVTQVVDKQSRKETPSEKPQFMCLSNAGSQDSEDWPLPEIPYDLVPIHTVSEIDSNAEYNKFISRKSVKDEIKQNESSDEDGVGNVAPAISVENATHEMIDPRFFHIAEATTFEEAGMSNDPFTGTFPSEDIYYSESSKYGLDNTLAACQIADTNNKTQNLMPSINSFVCLPPSFGMTCCITDKITYTQNNMSDTKNSDTVITSQPITSPQSIDMKIEIPTKDFKSPDLYSEGSDVASGSVFTFSHSGGGIHPTESSIKKSLKRQASTTACRKCSHSSYSEEETSSVETDAYGTVKMGLQHNKCTHSSHSEDTSVGLSISEWSTGTNMARHYTNLSKSDSLSGVLHHSSAKSEKSSHTKSNETLTNKSIESLNDKSTSTKHKTSSENGSSDGFQYDALLSSDTEKVTDSATKSDETTLTLTEIAQSITDWSTSSSITLTANDKYNKAQVDELVEYLEQEELARGIASTSSGASTSNDFPYFKSREAALKGFKPRIVGEIPKSFEINMNNSKTRYEITSKILRNQASLQVDSFYIGGSGDQLYPPEEKLAERYQSQEFKIIQLPKKQSIPTSTGTEIVPKNLSTKNETSSAKVCNYSDKTLSKSQIQEYRSTRMRRSYSLNEQQLQSFSEDELNESDKKTENIKHTGGGGGNNHNSFYQLHSVKEDTTVTDVDDTVSKSKPGVMHKTSVMYQPIKPQRHKKQYRDHSKLPSSTTDETKNDNLKKSTDSSNTSSSDTEQNKQKISLESERKQNLETDKSSDFSS